MLVIPNGETVLASPVAGRITAVNVGLGRPFRQGAVLISLDCGEPEARLAMATADIASATEEYEAKLRTVNPAPASISTDSTTEARPTTSEMRAP